MIINEAYFAIQEELATKEAIDDALRFGVNYPQGPFEWVQTFGEDKIYLILNHLKRITGHKRYEPCSLLKTRNQ